MVYVRWSENNAQEWITPFHCVGYRDGVHAISLVLRAFAHGPVSPTRQDPILTHLSLGLVWVSPALLSVPCGRHLPFQVPDRLRDV